MRNAAGSDDIAVAIADVIVDERLGAIDNCTPRIATSRPYTGPVLIVHVIVSLRRSTFKVRTLYTNGLSCRQKPTGVPKKAGGHPRGRIRLS